MTSAVYIAGMGMITPLGNTAPITYAMWRAEANAYTLSNYLTHDHHAITLALVPHNVLPPLNDMLDMSEALSFRDERLLLMSQVAIKEAIGAHPVGAVPLLFSGPENYAPRTPGAAGLTNQVQRQFLQHLQQQTAIPLHPNLNRGFATGRTGVLEALRLAQHYLHSGVGDYVLIGGVDSCQHSAYLDWLDQDGRLKSERHESKGDSFVPGEGAGFLLLTANPDKAFTNGRYRFALAAPGFGMEPGHLYEAQQPYRGDGLDQAVKAALTSLPEPHTIKRLYSTMTGEHFWAKEMGVSITRSSGRFSDQLVVEHPADSYGDLGAASAAGLITLACLDAARVANPVPQLICASSDHAYRAAVCLLPERITP